MAIATGQVVGQRLCKLLNIDPNRVRELVITVRPNEPAAIEIEMECFVFDPDTEVFQELYEEYEFVLKPK